MSIWMILLVVFVVSQSIRSAGRRGGWEWNGARGRTGGREMARLQSELDQRTADLELLATRVSELESRLDFTERLLVQQREAIGVTSGSRAAG